MAIYSMLKWIFGSPSLTLNYLEGLAEDRTCEEPIELRPLFIIDQRTVIIFSYDMRTHPGGLHGHQLSQQTSLVIVIVFIEVR